VVLWSKDILSIVQAEEPFTSEQAGIAGDLIAVTEELGLSLGNRTCLAMAMARRAPVYTTGQLWRELKVGVPVHGIR
jgi:PIN domain nuclease of toxin-antitoxin system